MSTPAIVADTRRRVGTRSVLTASVLWGTTGTAATLAPTVGPLAIAAVAMGLGGLLQGLTALRLFAQARPTLVAHHRLVVLGGAAVAIYPLAFYSSMHLAGVAVGTVVSVGSAPLASALIERIVDRHILTTRWAIGAAFGLAGTVLLCIAATTETSAGAGDSFRTTVLGVALGLVAGITYAMYSWTAHRLMNHGIPSRAAMGAVFGTGGLMLIPILVITGAPLVTSWTNAAVGAYMAIVPMFAGYVLFGWGLARIGASTATTLSMLEPAVAALLAVIIVGEQLPVIGWIGVALVLACLAVLTIRPAPATARDEQGRVLAAAVPKSFGGAAEAARP